MSRLKGLKTENRVRGKLDHLVLSSPDEINLTNRQTLSTWQNSRNRQILLPWLQGMIVHLTFRGTGSERGHFKTILAAFCDWNP